VLFAQLSCPCATRYTVCCLHNVSLFPARPHLLNDIPDILQSIDAAIPWGYVPDDPPIDGWLRLCAGRSTNRWLIEAMCLRLCAGRSTNRWLIEAMCLRLCAGRSTNRWLMEAMCLRLCAGRSTNRWLIEAMYLRLCAGRSTNRWLIARCFSFLHSALTCGLMSSAPIGIRWGVCWQSIVIMDGATVRVPIGTLIYRIRQTAVWTKHYNHVKLPTQCIYVFCLDLGKTAIISLCYINWLVLITEIWLFTAQWLLFVPTV
jgi:hypothetical protein